MNNNPCDIYDYNSDKYNSCAKDVVFEAAQDEWIMLDPRFPNIKGVTPKRMDEFLANAEMEGMKDYFIDYLQHVMVYDRDDIYKMCVRLGDQIEQKYPGKLHDPHTIFVTTPRGGHEVLSIFSYANDLDKIQIPSHIRSISEEEYKMYKRRMSLELESESYQFQHIKDLVKAYEKAIEYKTKNNNPIIPDIWLDNQADYIRNEIKIVFVIDDIIASGEQMLQTLSNVSEFFNYKVEIIPVVLVDRKDDDIDAIYGTEIVGTKVWDEARDFWKNSEDWSFGRKIRVKTEKYDSLITVRFPWGSPDGESDKILTTLYESRRGLERIERKRDRCILEPDKCELK